MPEYIDTHAHTNFDAFDDDRDEVYARAREAGLQAIVEVGVGLDGSRAAVARAAEVDMVHAAVGLHPTGLDTFDSDWPAFEELVRKNDVTAVGECGLDYHWMASPKELQADAFRRQIHLARQMALPYIVHCREAEDDVIAILKDEAYARGVVHCFGGTPAQARAILDLGLHISFCGNVTFPRNEALRETARAVPVERLFLETDSPFLSPQKKRGRRNEPAHVLFTAEFLASLHGIGVDELARRTTRNARRFFDLKDKAPGTITYRIGDKLYVNLTRLCTAHCYFCPREGPEMVAWGHDLALVRDPTAAEILDAVGDPAAYDEIVYCGLGEPTIRLQMLIETARALKAKGARIRINTNGHGNLIHGRDVAPELEGVVDAVSVSLNYGSAELYERHCPSTFGLDAWPGILDFACRAGKHVGRVTMTVVAGAEDVDVDACRKIAEECGVEFRDRPLDDLRQTA